MSLISSKNNELVKSVEDEIVKLRDQLFSYEIGSPERRECFDEIIRLTELTKKLRDARQVNPAMLAVIPVCGTIGVEVIRFIGNCIKISIIRSDSERTIIDRITSKLFDEVK